MVWRCRASKNGLQVIRDVCKSRGWRREVSENDDSLVAASNALDSAKEWPQEGWHGKIYAEGINEGSWRRFLGGKELIRLEIFAAYCLALEIPWEHVVDWPDAAAPIPLPYLPQALCNRDPSGNLDSKQEPQDMSEFIRDVTIPDGSIMQPGEKFTKIWAIRNAGNVTWKNRYLARMGACAGPALITSSKRVKIPHTMPGQQIEIAVELRSPEVATTTTAIWKMTFSDSQLCYPNRYVYGLSVVIQVLQ